MTTTQGLRSHSSPDITVHDSIVNLHCTVRGNKSSISMKHYIPPTVVERLNNFSIVMATSQWCAFNHTPLPLVCLPLRGKTSRECEGEFLDVAQEESSYGTHIYTVQVRDNSPHEGGHQLHKLCSSSVHELCSGCVCVVYMAWPQSGVGE